ncbi:putative tryptophan-rich sensory protein [Methanocella paludicola SANAE]|uniref:Tryptophan-rich sensory protein n=1 Tax=Methanocella paludicola (strain DSM 17711 / JCM 13418 / NBRC 101707 / SANAE) TaxID=304371 RepID=D1Z154_METPS|nr:TspO/MBR family protein [Methanocella paludicola]BAI62426.1 putative tryptophan-rich sensory protein [Methanocella paludicola SANAE]
MKFNDIVKLVAALAASFLAALIGSVFTIPSITTWYASLNKPFFTPPDWLFGPAWTILYLLMAIALFLVWRLPQSKQRDSAIAVYAAQLIMNVLWSVGFFGFHNILLGVALILLLLALIVLTTYEFYGLSKPAAYAMVPYILWVSFATCLNVAVFLLNP